MNFNPLRNVLHQYVSDQKYTPAAIKKYAEELQNRVAALISSAKKFGKNNEIEEQLSSVKTSFEQDVAQSQLSFSKEKDSLKSLCQQNCLEKTTELKILSEKEDLDYSSLIDLLEAIATGSKEKSNDLKKLLQEPYTHSSLDEWSKKNAFDSREFLKKIFDKALEKCKKLKEKTELQKDKIDLNNDIIKSILSRLNHLISPDKISKTIENSSKKDPARVQKHKNFESVRDKSYIAYKSLEACIDRNLISSKINPELSTFFEKINELNLYFNELDQALKNVRCFILFPDNFNSLPTEMQNYADFKKQFEAKVKIFEDCEESKPSMEQKIQKFYTEISAAIEPMTKDKDFPEWFEVVEEIPHEQGTKSLMSIHTISNIENVNEEQNYASFSEFLTHAVKDLQLLHNAIQSKWSDSLAIIEKNKCRKEIYLTFNEITENLSLCNFLAKNIYDNIKAIISTENDKVQHIAGLKENVQDFKILCDLIVDSSKEKISNEKFKKLKEILGKDLNGFSSLYEKAMDNSTTLSPSLHEVFYSVESSGIQEFTKCKENLRSDLKELDKICTLIVKEIDRGRKAVATCGNNPAYDNCFIQAYFSENSKIEYIQDWGSSIKNGITYSGSLILRSSQEVPKEEYAIDQVVSPFTNLTHLLEL
jgi:hypothetical protein